MIHPLAVFKGWLAKHMLIIEFCDACGRRMDLVWHTSDILWKRLVPEGGCLCTRCFDGRARKQHLLVMWRADLDGARFMSPTLNLLPDAVFQRIPDSPCCQKTAEETAAILQLEYLKASERKCEADIKEREEHRE